MSDEMGPRTAAASAGRCLVIAEAGVNHDGSVETAMKLASVAKMSGADVVKFQTFEAQRLATRFADKAPYQAQRVGLHGNQASMLERLQLSREEFRMIADYCREIDIEFLSTGFDVPDVEFLLSLGVSRLKVPSGDITNYQLLDYVGGRGLPVILSTGMSTLTEVQEAVDVLSRAGLRRDQLVVLQCTTAYPTPVEDVNLLAMVGMGRHLDVAYGLSDHTVGIVSATAAVALGARVLEKHLTLDRSGDGPDHAASLNPNDFGHLVSALRETEACLGSAKKEPAPSELENLLAARRSLVATRPIQKGEELTHSNIGAKRPGGGMSPMLLPRILGTRATRDYRVEEALRE